MQGQAQGHDVCVMFTEFQGRGIPGEGVQIHAEEIDRELTVDVVEFVFVFSVILV